MEHLNNVKCLTIHSSRRRFAARLNSGVRARKGDIKMKTIRTLLCLLFLVAVPVYAGQADTIDLSKDNPNTLIHTRSTDYTIQGFQLGLTHGQAWKILENNNLLLGERDGANPSRIYVYSRAVDGSKGEAVLYLIWEPEEREMRRITVFQDCRGFLSESFRRLLTFEAVDGNSEFKRKFIGYPNRSKITLDIPSIDLKHTTYYYDEIGLEITHKHSSEGEEVVFAVVQPKP